MVGVNVVASDDEHDAASQFEARRRALVRTLIARGPGNPSYTDAQIDEFIVTPQGRQLADMLRYSAVGTTAQVRQYLESFADSTTADELIVVHQSPRIADRLRSVELAAEAMRAEAA
jgi:putative transposase